MDYFSLLFAKYLANLHSGGGDTPTRNLLLEADLDNWILDGLEGIYYQEYTVDSNFTLPINIVVDWDGTEYECTYDEDMSGFGAVWNFDQRAFDFSAYPFFIDCKDLAKMPTKLGANSDSFLTFIIDGGGNSKSKSNTKEGGGFTHHVKIYG